MTTNRESVVQYEPIGSSVPLNVAGPLTEAQLAGKSHIPEMRNLRFDVESVSGNAAGTYVLWTVPPGVEVISVDGIIITAFTAAVTLVVKDSANWIASADWNEQANGSTARSVIAAETNANGKYFAATDTIDLVIAGATALVGALGVKITFIDWNKYKAQALA